MFVGEDSHYVDGPDYEARVYEVVAADVNEALVAGGASPVKAALETLRALRDTLRFAIEFKGRTLSSHLDFAANMQSRFARLVAGPPVQRCQQLLALIDAGILNLPFGPSPELEAQPEGGYTVSVQALPEVVTEGDSEAEAMAMAEEAIRLVLAYRRDNGIPLPTH